MKVVWFTDYYQYYCFINTVLYSIDTIAKYNYYGNPRKLKLILDPYNAAKPRINCNYLQI